MAWANQGWLKTAGWILEMMFCQYLYGELKPWVPSLMFWEWIAKATKFWIITGSASGRNCSSEKRDCKCHAVYDSTALQPCYDQTGFTGRTVGYKNHTFWVLHWLCLDWLDINHWASLKLSFKCWKENQRDRNGCYMHSLVLDTHCRNKGHAAHHCKAH